MSIIVNIKKISFTLVNFFVFYNVIKCNNEKKRCSSGKYSNKNKEETINVDLKGKTGYQYEHNEIHKDNDDNNDDNDPNKPTEEDKKFDFEEHKYIQKSANFYSLSSACRSLILKIKQFDDVKVFEESLKKAGTEEDLKEIEKNLTVLIQKRDGLITKINGELNKVGLSLIDLNCSNFIINSYKIKELNDLNNEIGDKILKYFEDKIKPLKKEIEEYGKKEGVSKSKEYKDYKTYIDDSNNGKNLKDYLTKINEFEKAIYTVWQDLVDLADLNVVLDNLIKEIETEISNVEDKTEKGNFTKKIGDIKNKRKVDNDNKGVKKCIEEVKNLKESVENFLDKEKKEKVLKENIEKIEEIIKLIKGLIDELEKVENNEKYSKKITGDFTTKFDNLKGEKEELWKKSVEDLSKKQSDLSDLRLEIENYIELVNEFKEVKNKKQDKDGNMVDINIENTELNKIREEIINTYNSNIDEWDKLTLNRDYILNINILFEYIEKIITNTKNLKKLMDGEAKKPEEKKYKEYYINKIVNYNYKENLESGKINTASIENIKKYLDEINKTAIKTDTEILLGEIKYKINCKDEKNKEIKVVDLLNNNFEIKDGLKSSMIIKDKISNDINSKLLPYLKARYNDKNIQIGFKKFIVDIFIIFKITKSEKKLGNLDFSENEPFDKIEIPKIRTKLNKFYNDKKDNYKDGEYMILIYNLIKNLFLNLEINYYNNSKKYNKTNVNVLDVEFVKPLD